MSELKNRETVKIKVSKGNEYKILIMDVYDQEDFFHTSFQRASAAITEIVNRSLIFEKSNMGDERLTPGLLTVSNYPNNIVAFCAERGQGKTSAMISMSEALRALSSCSDRRDRRLSEFWNDRVVKGECDTSFDNPVLNTGFVILDPIDPTMMEKNDSIIKNVISKMYKSAAEKWERITDHNGSANNELRDSQKYKDALLKKFVQCFRGADRLHRDGADSMSSYDDLHMLAEYGDSTSFKKALYELVKMYLDFMSINDKARSMLVIQIDDADLNIKNAHAISEEIRKYLVMPGVMVMMALNMGTMSRTIEQYFLSQYKDYARYGERSLIRRKCHDIMEKYIEKLLPSSHRINIPKVDDYIRDAFNRLHLEYVEYGHEKEGKDLKDTIVIDDRLVNHRVDKNLYQEKLILLIYQKTGIILTKPDYFLHVFLPHNLRMLNHFIMFLSGLDDVVEPSGRMRKRYFESVLGLCKEYFSNDKPEELQKKLIDTVDRRLYNLRKFYEYFMCSWCTMYLDYQQLEIIEMIDRTSRTMKLQRALKLLTKYAEDKKWTGIIKRQQPGAGDDYVSFSDMMNMIQSFKKVPNPKEQFSFVCALQLYFSIYLHTLAMEELKLWLKDPDKMDLRSPFEELVKFTGYHIFPLDYYREKGIKKLKIKVTDHEKHAWNRRLYYFFYHYTCAITETQSGDVCVFNPQNAPVIDRDRTNNDCQLKPDYVYFDVFRPLITTLGEEDFMKDFFGESSPQGSIELLSSLLRLICNIDIQDMLHEKFFMDKEKSEVVNEYDDFYDFFERSSNEYRNTNELVKEYFMSREKADKEGNEDEEDVFPPFFEQVLGLYGKIDATIKNNLIMRSQSSIVNMLKEKSVPSARNKSIHSMIEPTSFDCIVTNEGSGFHGEPEPIKSLYCEDDGNTERFDDSYQIDERLFTLADNERLGDPNIDAANNGTDKSTEPSEGLSGKDATPESADSDVGKVELNDPDLVLTDGEIKSQPDAGE